jgi:hypothetical protein
MSHSADARNSGSRDSPERRPQPSLKQDVKAGGRSKVLSPTTAAPAALHICSQQMLCGICQQGTGGGHPTIKRYTYKDDAISARPQITELLNIHEHSHQVSSNRRLLNSHHGHAAACVLTVIRLMTCRLAVLCRWRSRCSSHSPTR